MIVMGIDPGYAIVGYGIIQYDSGRFKVIDYGAITTDAGTPFNERLESIYDEFISIAAKYKPDVMAIEKLFFNTNQKTGIDVAQARGVTLLAATNAGIPIYEYTPLQIKMTLKMSIF